MPGFTVNGVGNKSTPSRAKFYYSYTWSIVEVFGKIVSLDDNVRSTYQPLVYCRDATLPKYSIGKEIVHGGSIEYKYAKHITWADCNIVWYDTSGLLSLMKNWRQNVWTQYEGIKAASEYKFKTTLSNYLPTHAEPVTWELYGSWPSEIRYGDLTYTTSEAKVVEAVITYDWAEEFFATDAQHA